MIPSTCPAEYEEPFASLTPVKREEILNRAKALAKLIQANYQGRRPGMVCVLKGPVR
jgi:hypoxanthine-guanine phosphoribosyltransferase